MRPAPPDSRRVVLRRLRIEAGHSQESLAAKLAASRTTVSNWERGVGGLPHPDLRRRYALELNLTVEELEHLFAAGELPTTPHTTASAGSPTAVVLPGPVHLARATPFGGIAVGRSELDQTARTIDHIVDRYEHTGPTVMAPVALDLQARVSQWMGGSLRQRDRIEVYRFAAQIAGLLGYMAVNVGSFRLADAYCGQALYLADEAGDLDLSLWVRGTQAHCAYYEGRWDLAVEYARAGYELAPKNPQSIRLLVNGEARSQAKLGRPEMAERAVGEAMDLLDKNEADGRLTPCISLEPYRYPRLAGNAATAHVAAGDVNRVLDFTRSLDDEVESLDSEWSRALVSLDVAATLLKTNSPEIDEAMRLGQRALDVSAARPIRSIWQRATELGHLAQPWSSHPSVAEYSEAYTTWSTTGATVAVGVDA